MICDLSNICVIILSTVFLCRVSLACGTLLDMLFTSDIFITFVFLLHFVAPRIKLLLLLMVMFF